MLIGYRYTSLVEKSRTRKAGESMAPCSAHPRATDSSALSVRETSRPRRALSVAPTHGIREPPPMTSHEKRSSLVRPASSKQRCTVVSSLSSHGLAHSSSSARSHLTLTSMSLMKHSIDSVDVGIDDSVLRSFSAAVRRRKTVFGDSNASILCFSCHTAWQCRAMSMSRSRVPIRSDATAFTTYLPLEKETICTVRSPWPRSKIITLRAADSSGRSVL
mmetsp:Transcript_16533/g.51448  ORF Transcript_16533/g.51448 Transcript_16533/m.51448 type:complete len:218 (+) Transcript_16533:497-1150(+)